jgi:hypothetical protein
VHVASTVADPQIHYLAKTAKRRERELSNLPTDTMDKNRKRQVCFAEARDG